MIFMVFFFLPTYLPTFLVSMICEIRNQVGVASTKFDLLCSQFTMLGLEITVLQKKKKDDLL